MLNETDARIDYIGDYAAHIAEVPPAQRICGTDGAEAILRVDMRPIPPGDTLLVDSADPWLNSPAQIVAFLNAVGTRFKAMNERPEAEAKPKIQAYFDPSEPIITNPQTGACTFYVAGPPDSDPRELVKTMRLARNDMSSDLRLPESEFKAMYNAPTQPAAQAYKQAWDAVPFDSREARFGASQKV